jgi:hypothetical protein
MTVRSIFYTVAVLASLGVVGAVVSNPQIVQQCTTLLGLSNNKVEETDKNNPDEDMLTQFFRTDENTPINTNLNNLLTTPQHNTSTTPPNSATPPPITTIPFAPFHTTPNNTHTITTPSNPTPSDTTLPDHAISNPTHSNPTHSNPTPSSHSPLFESSSTLPAIAPAAPVAHSPALANNVFPTPNNNSPNTTNTPILPPRIPISIPPANVFPLQDLPPNTIPNPTPIPNPISTPINANIEKNITPNITPQHEITTGIQNSSTTSENLSSLEQWSDPVPFAINTTNQAQNKTNPNNHPTPHHNSFANYNPDPDPSPNTTPDLSPYTNSEPINSDVLPFNPSEVKAAFEANHLVEAKGVDIFGQLPPNEIDNNSTTINVPENNPKNIDDFSPMFNGAIFPVASPAVAASTGGNVAAAAIGQPEVFPLPSTQPISSVSPISPNPSTPLPTLSSSPHLPHQLSAIAINPSVIAEEVPCIGTETVARVGCEVILMCDILPQLRRFGYRLLRENIDALPPEQRAMVTEEEKNMMLSKCIEMHYQEFLKMQIEGSLVYNDFLMTMPRDQISFYEKRLNEEFDRKDVPAMIKEFGVLGNTELKRFLEEKLGSSIDRERMLATRNKIIQMWAARSVQDSDVESTCDELNEYYKQHIEDFTTKERVRWKEMVVLYSNFSNKQEAFKKINWLLGEVRRGVNFEGLAKLNSDGLTAPKGGVRDWTKRGEMSSKIIEKVIFEIPVNQISNIIEAENGFHIVLVTDHQSDTVIPFIDAQATIRRKIKMERLQKNQAEYFESLKQKYRVIVLRKDFNLNMAKPINRPLN